ncbi:hypothetical protein PRVXT_002149 [Proteinivorax tanatarense]|uniref:SHOCT domain-containing protein n=1 Tax=Proteinivorax tanatarense TaxID=1260629 RepID=A0AAU7VJ96_9FIRM
MRKLLIGAGVLTLIVVFAVPTFASESFSGYGWGRGRCHGYYDDDSNSYSRSEIREDRQQRMLDRINERVADGEITVEEGEILKEHILDNNN